MSEPDKGKFTADISQQVIDEALQSVEENPSPNERGSAAPEKTEPSVDLSEPQVLPEPQVQTEVRELQEQLALSQEKGRETMARLQEAHERMLHSVADLENYRKRAQKEKEQIKKFGSEKILTDFLPVLDNLDRALEHANSSADFTSLMQGVSMTRKLFEDALAKHGVKPIPAVGHPFDPHFHEAIQQLGTQELPPNHVMSELVPGYTLNDRLLRPALVVVSKAPPRDAPETSSEHDSKSFHSPTAQGPGPDEREP